MPITIARKNTFRNKIKTTAELTEIIRRLRAERNTIVHCHGCFDLLHVAHLHQFEQARDQGDVLVVSLTADRFVNKGPGRPVFNQNQRADMIAALEIIDFVTISEAPYATTMIELFKPDVYVKGESCRELEKDETCGFYQEKLLVESFGGRVFYTHEMPIHSTNILKYL